MVYQNVLELIGRSPMIRLNKIASQYSVYAKLELSNPGGSVKDRIALNMIEDAEEKGELKPGGTIIEPTSGNTGIGLAMVAAVKNYDVLLVMPESMSAERKKLLKTYGVKLVLTPKRKGMSGAIEKANQLLKNNPDYFMPSQFDNPANPEAHQKTTAQEILKDLDRVDALVLGVGTGGTLTGTAKVLRNKFPDIKIVAVEPEESAVLSGKSGDSHMIQGIGAGFIPEVLEEDLIDKIITVESKEAFKMSIKLAQVEGILAGISAGANLKAALETAESMGRDNNIVTIFPDTGERYLSMHGSFQLM